ncbi:MAG: hypothetical protein QM708_01575 [Propioniciclava sp.]|uniref:hypothetical protein n=1 Tax=Propioniciclava sp. TaxID=2038686 RepID=UPI0039E23992
MRRMIPFLFLLLAGCTPPAPPPSGVDGPSAPVPAAIAPSAAPTALPVLESRDTSSHDTPLTVAVNSVRTAPRATTVDFTLTNRGAATWFVESRLSTSFEHDVSGVFLVDAVAGKRYLPARDGEERCVCSGTRTGGLGPGDSVTFSAVFAPLPSDLDRVRVHIPLGGIFDVPVTR